jgi:isopentenyl diphosphate isomerase/L-lactate dehydrogenase-like FMN-dependent dehydrogenase
MIEMLKEDFTLTMQLCGCRTLKDIDRSCLWRMNADGILARL